MPPFGKRVVGNAAFDKALREEKGGAAVFGVRVRGAIREEGPISIAKRNTEHGVRVVADAKAQDEKGNDAETVSIESLRNILAENPTFFDSLYEAELAREDGARPEALEIFIMVETGIKGAGRREIIDEIRTLLGVKSQQAAAVADEALLRQEQLKRQAKREEENRLLGDADRVKALKERQENIDAVKEGSGKDQLTTTPADTNRQLDSIAEEMGIDRTPKGHVPTTPSKPEGNINVETQQPGNRITTPKAVTDAGNTGDESGKKADEQETDFDSMTVAELRDHIGEEEVGKIEGSGADGRVVKDDLVKAAKKAAKKKAK